MWLFWPKWVVFRPRRCFYVVFSPDGVFTGFLAQTVFLPVSQPRRWFYRFFSPDGGFTGFQPRRWFYGFYSPDSGLQPRQWFYSPDSGFLPSEPIKPGFGCFSTLGADKTGFLAVFPPSEPINPVFWCFPPSEPINPGFGCFYLGADKTRVLVFFYPRSR